MQEIAPQIFIETGFVGVTVGAINWSHGLILVDAPFLVEEVRSWRSSLQNMGGGINILLVILDAHYDRTLGTRTMDCTVIAHEQVAQVFRDRPVSFKPQISNTGAEFEQHNCLGGVRWSVPEITFSERIEIHCDDHPVVLEHHPGPAQGATWVILPEQHIVFVGDAIVPNAPPFFNSADIPVWIDTLNILLSPAYKNYILISSRGGITTHQQIRDQLHYLERVHNELEKLTIRNAPPEDTEKLLPALMKHYKTPIEKQSQYHQRLAYGLYKYYVRHYQFIEPETIDE